MSSFTFIAYSGADAGTVLSRILKDGVPHEEDESEDEGEQGAKTKLAIGFQPNPEAESDGEND